jgi:hypothetical protein
MMASVSTGRKQEETVLGIAASAILLIDDMDYDQYRLVIPFDILLVTINVLINSFSFFTS